MKEKINLKIKVDIIFFILVIFISFVPLGYAISFLPFIVTGGKIVLVLVFGSLFVVGLYSKKEQILDFFLIEELLERLDIYIIKWKSKEFDEFVGRELLELYTDSQNLRENYRSENGSQNILYPLSDYAPLVLPIAKVYEGILKKILVEAKIVSENELLQNPSLNVGKYFNPAGNNKIFNFIKDKSRDKVVPHVIYSTYQECRNQILHYDQYRDNRIVSMEDAEFYVKRILHAIDKAYDTFKK